MATNVNQDTGGNTLKVLNLLKSDYTTIISGTDPISESYGILEKRKLTRDTYSNAHVVSALRDVLAKKYTQPWVNVDYKTPDEILSAYIVNNTEESRTNHHLTLYAKQKDLSIDDYESLYRKNLFKLKIMRKMQHVHRNKYCVLDIKKYYTDCTSDIAEFSWTRLFVDGLNRDQRGDSPSTHSYINTSLDKLWENAIDDSRTRNEENPNSTKRPAISMNKVIEMARSYESLHSNNTRRGQKRKQDTSDETDGPASGVLHHKGCNKRHGGPCLKCNKCNGLGHTGSDCRNSKKINNGQGKNKAESKTTTTTNTDGIGTSTLTNTTSTPTANKEASVRTSRCYACFQVGHGTKSTSCKMKDKTWAVLPDGFNTRKDYCTHLDSTSNGN